MKIITAFCFVIVSSTFAEPIPARDPLLGESRPSWWWEIWNGRVVVIEGKITFKKFEKPDICIEFNKERIKDIIPDDKTRELQLKLTDFYVGELEISKFYYADGGACNLDGNLQRTRNGAQKKLKVLIPILRLEGNSSLYGSGIDLQPDVENIGIHVFDYSNLILGLKMVYSSSIPKENLLDAQAVFKLREKQFHSGGGLEFPTK